MTVWVKTGGQVGPNSPARDIRSTSVSRPSWAGVARLFSAKERTRSRGSALRAKARAGNSDGANN
jgi:hypothetical protein